MKGLDFEGLARYLLPMAGELLTAWFPRGRRRGNEYVIGDISGAEGDSLGINLNTGKWADFNGKESGGDLISLYAAWQGIGNGEAAKRLAIEFNYDLGSDTPPKVKTRGPEVMYPPPEHPGPPSMRSATFGDPVAVWTYRTESGAPIYYVARYDKDGKKTFFPYCYIGDGLWAQKA